MKGATVLLVLLPAAAAAADCLPEASDGAGRFVESVELVREFSRGEALRLAEGGAASAALPAAIRAQLVEALMRGTTGDREERAILSLLRAAEPADRAETLREIDRGEDHYDVVKLVFDDIDDPGRRAELLALAEKANDALRAEGRLEVGVISDIDDTAVPDAFRPDGRDGFEGAAALYERLENGADGTGLPGHVHYVTGRPPIARGDLEGRLRRGGLPPGTFSLGDLGAVVFGGLDGLANEKVRDIERLLAAHPGQRFVLLGDDRQRDPEVYREIVRRHPDRISAVLIHRAGGSRRDPSGFERTTFFDRYADARAAID